MNRTPVHRLQGDCFTTKLAVRDIEAKSVLGLKRESNPASSFTLRLSPCGGDRSNPKLRHSKSITRQKALSQLSSTLAELARFELAHVPKDI